MTDYTATRAAIKLFRQRAEDACIMAGHANLPSSVPPAYVRREIINRLRAAAVHALDALDEAEAALPKSKSHLEVVR